MGLAIYLGTLVLAVALPWLADPEVRRVLRRRRRMEDTLLGLAAFERAGGQVQSVDRIAAVIRRGSRSFWVQIVLPFPSLGVWLAFDPSFVWVGSLVAAATCISTEVRGASNSEPTNAVGLAEPPTALLRRFRIGALCVKGGLLAAASAAAFYAVTASGPWAPVRALLLSVASVLVFKHAHLVLTMTERLVRRSSPVDFDALPGGGPEYSCCVPSRPTTCGCSTVWPTADPLAPTCQVAGASKSW